MYACRNLLKAPAETNYGRLLFSVHEVEISSERKMLSRKGISYCEWFSVQVIPVGAYDRLSTCQLEFIANWQSITSVECNALCNPLVMSFDLECYSSNPRAMPDRNNSRDCITMVSVSFRRVFGESDQTKRFVIVLGNCSDVPPDSRLEVTIIKVGTEQDLIDQWCQLVLSCDPDILCGYNIYSFDYPYLEARNLKANKTFPSLGRIMGEPATMENLVWESSAYGYQDNSFLATPGRLSIDMLTIVKRDHKLEIYKVDFVAKYFLGKSKHDVTPQEIFRGYENMVQRTRDVERALPNPPENWHSINKRSRMPLTGCLR